MEIMKINIGGGRKVYEGFLNLDIDPSCNPDIIVDLEIDKLPFEDNTIEEVKAYHILEHLGQGFFHLFQELYRVCKHGAIIDIQVPHPLHLNFITDPTHMRPVTTDGMNMFSKKANDEWIATNSTTSCLAYRFGVDFEVISSELIVDPFYHSILPGMKEEDQMRLAREVNNFFMEIYMKLVVIKC